MKIIGMRRILSCLLGAAMVLSCAAGPLAVTGYAKEGAAAECGETEEGFIELPAEIEDTEEGFEEGITDTGVIEDSFSEIVTDTEAMEDGSGEIAADTAEMDDSGFAIEAVEEIAAEEQPLQAGISVNAQNVTLYALGSSWEPYLSIPSGVRQSFRITVSGTAGKPAFRVISGRSAKVSADGVVTPVSTTWYWNGGIGSTAGDPETADRVTVDYEYGESVIEVTAAGQTFFVNVSVEDYAQYYAERQIDAYLAEKITPSMTTYEKVKAVCEYTASFDYSAATSSYVGMVVSKGGDCWASTGLICHMCEKLGIPSYVRYAANDPGAGSGHRNCLVEIDGKMWVADAGYSGTAPRYYDLHKLTSEYSYRFLEDGTIELTQYEGKNPNVVIPAEINGYTVTSIGRGAFANAVVDITSVTFPDTITNIGEQSFYWCDKLETAVLPKNLKTIGKNAFSRCGSLQQIKLPAAVESISEFAFADSNNLKQIQVDGANPFYCSVDGVVFGRDKKKLIFYPCGKAGAYTVPSGTTELADYAFYYAKKLTSLTLPEGITVIPEGFCGECSALTSVSLPSSLKKIRSFAFANCTSLKKVVLPLSVEQLEDAAFGYYYGMVFVRNSSTVFGEQVFHERTQVCGKPGSTAEQYASENRLNFLQMDASNRIALQKEWFESGREQVYDGQMNPGFLKEDAPVHLTEGIDYTVTGWAAGNSKVQITGKGDFCGTVTIPAVIKISAKLFEADPVPTQHYTGADIEPKLTVRYNGKILKENTDYVVSYYDNWDIGNGGAYIQGIGNYSGRISVSFVIAAGSNHEWCEHEWGKWSVSKYPTVFEKGKKQRRCVFCGTIEEASTSKLKPTATVNMKTVHLQVKQKTTALKVTGLARGDSVKSYKSSNRKIVTVSTTGKLTAKKKGSASITVTLASGKTVTVKVYVQKTKVKTTKLTINKTKLSLKKGKTYRLKATRAPLTSQQKVSYTSSNRKVATVSSSGKIKAKKKGTAVITVRSGSKKAKCRVTVK